MRENKETLHREYIRILKEELIPAMGCTEPIAIAYAASKAKDVLGKIPEEIEIVVSSNIIKNVKSVLIPNTGGLKGIEAAVAAGIIAGCTEKKLQVISNVSQKDKEKIKEYLEQYKIKVTPVCGKEVFEILITVRNEKDEARVKIIRMHTNIVLVEKNQKILYKAPKGRGAEKVDKINYSLLNVEDIIEFAKTADIRDVENLIVQEMEYNYAIAEEGIKNPYGAEVGRTILEYSENTPRDRAKAMAAAGSDARMGGCELPVIIVAGSGNQGITSSVPIIAYAKEMEYTSERIIRAILLSNLLSIYQRSLIGRLSAYCGAVNAGCSAAAGIAYLDGKGTNEIIHTLINSLAVVSGIIRDGAKPSCAAKIAASIDAGFLGYDMYKSHRQFHGGDGIVTGNADETIHNIGILGKDGMRGTDQKIIEIMMTCKSK